MGSYKHELEDDKIVKKHLGKLYQTMLEQNLCRIIEPYSKVQVKHIAAKIELPEAQVEKKLSQMILDKKFQGILDQVTDQLECIGGQTGGGTPWSPQEPKKTC